MKHQLVTTIDIDASLETVWNTFSNFTSYSEWSSFIHSIQGKVEVGQKIKVEIGTMKFNPKVLVFDQKKEFTWRGRLILPYLFDGKHSFLFRESADGNTKVIHKEQFHGILVPFMKKKLNSEILEGFKSWNARLKQRSESLVATSAKL